MGRVVQSIAKPTPDFYIGHGKAEEVGRRLNDLGATIVIFDEELSRRQGKHLEDLLKVRVMDRTELILDIFALRARSRDRGVVRVALVGYRNAGKSNLLRALTGADAHVEDRLFVTLDTESREVQVNGRRLRFTDTVGFIRKLPHDLVASFRATLEEAAKATATCRAWPKHCGWR